MDTNSIRLEMDNVESEKAEVFDVMYANFSDMLAEIDQLQTELDKHHWIPVSERLPEKGQHVLVRWIPHIEGLIDEIELLLWDNDWPSEVEITHWKPIVLPKK